MCSPWKKAQPHLNSHRAQAQRQGSVRFGRRRLAAVPPNPHIPKPPSASARPNTGGRRRAAPSLGRRRRGGTPSPQAQATAAGRIHSISIRLLAAAAPRLLCLAAN
uniref:Uncharacterized protein n=1 Tax=Setaria viridis TaxID=4556 RepID=A0A4U6UL18_SETVI|nr:hypothetical protein SEVIR_5G200732v2 [Setaria viridis]